MQDILLLDENYAPFGRLLDDYESFIWRRRYAGTDDYELHTGERDWSDLKAASYVCRSGSNTIGMIEARDCKGGKATVSGRSLKQALGDIVIYPTQYLEGTAEEVIRALVAEFTELPLGAIAGVGTEISVQITGDNLLDYINKLCTEQEITCDIFYSFSTDALEFRVWAGLDRTEGQSTNPRAVFSEEFENVEGFGYSESDKNYNNYAIVAGTGEGAARIFEVVDQSAGGRRREVWVDAKNVKAVDAAGLPLTEPAYRLMLRQKGREKLAGYKKVQVLEAELAAQSNLVYRVDYDLGDIVTNKATNLGLMAEKRIWEAWEIYEAETPTISIVFGEDYVTTTEFLKKELTD